MNAASEWYTIESVFGEAGYDQAKLRMLMWLGRRAAQHTRDAGLQPGVTTISGRPYTVGIYPGWAIGQAWLDWQEGTAL